MHHARGPAVSAAVLALCAACSTTHLSVPPPAPAPGTVSSGQRTDVLTRLGDDVSRGGDPSGAISLYRAAYVADPHNPRNLQRMGDAFLAMNEPARAEQAFRGALMLASDDEEARRGLALSLLGEGRAAEALPLLQQLADGSADPRLLRAEGTALDMLGRQAEAQAVYRRALRYAPIDPDLHGNLALSLALSGDSQNALREIQAAVASPNPDPRQNANAVLVLAMTGYTAAAQSRGEATLGAEATRELLDRASQARAATTAPARAVAIGLMTAPGAGAGGTSLIRSAPATTRAPGPSAAATPAAASTAAAR